MALQSLDIVRRSATTLPEPEIRLGTGGPTFNIESLNGDLRIRKSK